MSHSFNDDDERCTCCEECFHCSEHCGCSYDPGSGDHQVMTDGEMDSDGGDSEGDESEGEGSDSEK